jgi:hypothetical protein
LSIPLFKQEQGRGASSLQKRSFYKMALSYKIHLHAIRKKVREASTLEKNVFWQAVFYQSVILSPKPKNIF